MMEEDLRTVWQAVAKSVQQYAGLWQAGGLSNREERPSGKLFKLHTPSR